MPCDADLRILALLAGLHLKDAPGVAAALEELGMGAAHDWLSLEPDGEDLHEALDELKAARVALGDRRKLKAALVAPQARGRGLLPSPATPSSRPPLPPSVPLPPSLSPRPPLPPRVFTPWLTRDRSSRRSRSRRRRHRRPRRTPPALR